MHRHLAILALAATVVLMSACSDDDDDDDVTGTWFLNLVESDVYLHITSSSYDVYQVPEAACVTRHGYDIVDVDGSVYTLEPEDEPGTTSQLELRRSGSSLLVGSLPTTYETSSVDVGEFELCASSASGL